MRIRVKVDDRAVLRALQSRIPSALRKAGAAGVRSGAILLTRAVKQNIIGNRYGRRIQATGQLMQSVGMRLEQDGLKALVGPSAAKPDQFSHGFWIERGREPGRRPPIAPLELWVRTKLRIRDEREARSVAFAIARRLSAGVGGGKFHMVGMDVKQGHWNRRPFMSDAAKENRAAVVQAIHMKIQEAVEKIRAEKTKQITLRPGGGK